MPIHRLNEAPDAPRRCWATSPATRTARSTSSSTCATSSSTLELHPFNGEPYYLGAFLVGAYQEILGDLHNLFGDTNAVHVSLDDDGEVMLDAVIKGDTVREVLDYVQFDAERSSESCAIRSRPRSARAESTSRNRPPACASTRTACTATRIWKIQANSRNRQSIARAGRCI